MVRQSCIKSPKSATKVVRDMAENWPQQRDTHTESDNCFRVIKLEVESLRLFQDDQLGNISEHNNSLALHEGALISKVYWMEQDTYCYQFELGPHRICRREDTHFINASKLIRLAPMTRGRRDGILRSEKVRYITRKGQTDFKGVWVPFERAKYLAVLANIFSHVQALFSYDMESVYQSLVRQRISGSNETMERVWSLQQNGGWRGLKNDNSKTTRFNVPRRHPRRQTRVDLRVNNWNKTFFLGSPLILYHFSLVFFDWRWQILIINL